MPDELFNRFVDAWNAGDRPDVDDYLAKVPDDERSEFLRMVSLFLEQAPTPPLTDEQRQALQAQPAYRQAAGLAGTERGLWSTLLPRLRTRLKLTREQVVARLAEQLGVSSEEERVKVYYHRMETGQLDPAGVSRSVLAALAKLLNADVSELEEAGDFRGIVGPEAAAIYMRAGDLDAAAADASAPAPEAPARRDEVDRLFTGGR